MDLLKSIIARDEDGDLVDKNRNKVMQLGKDAGEQRKKPAPARKLGM